MSKDDSAITNKVLLEHMQAMQQRLENKIDGVKKSVSSLEKKLGKRIDRVKTDILDEMNRRHDALSEDIAAIIEDATTVKKRVDHIETKRLSRIERKLSLA